MAAVGSRDGREVAVQLNDLRGIGKLLRNADGQYLIGSSEAGRTLIHGPKPHDPNDHT